MAQSSPDAELAGALQDELQWVPVEHDWSFNADQMEGGFNRYGWGPIDQTRFDECWDEEAGKLADRLIAAYGALWPWAMDRLAVAHHPSFAACVRGLAQRREVGAGHTYRNDPGTVFIHAMMSGSFDHMRALRGANAWRPAPWLLCSICDTRFWAAVLSPWMIRQSWGAPIRLHPFVGLPMGTTSRGFCSRW